MWHLSCIVGGSCKSDEERIINESIEAATGNKVLYSFVVRLLEIQGEKIQRAKRLVI